MSITNVGVVTALTHNNGDAMLLIFGAAIVLIVFFIIDIISLIVLDLLAGQFQSIEHGGGHDDRCTMLVVMEDRNAHAGL